MRPMPFGGEAASTAGDTQAGWTRYTKAIAFTNVAVCVAVAGLVALGKRSAHREAMAMARRDSATNLAELDTSKFNYVAQQSTKECLRLGATAVAAEKLGGLSEAAVAKMPALVYLGSDIDLHMLRYLRDFETRAIYVDSMRRQNPDVFLHYHKLQRAKLKATTDVPQPLLDQRPLSSFGKTTSAFRPWPGAQTKPDRKQRAKFSALVAERLREEGFECVEEADVASTTTVVFTFVLRGIPRRLDFVVADALDVFKEWAQRRWLEETRTLVGVGIPCVMISEAVRSFAIAAQSKLSNQKPGHAIRLIYGFSPTDSKGIKPLQAGKPMGAAIDEVMAHFQEERRDARGHRCTHQESVWAAQLPGWTVSAERDLTEYPVDDTLAGHGTHIKAVTIVRGTG